MTKKINRRNLLKASAGLTGLFISPSILSGLNDSTLVEKPFEGTTHQSLSRHGNLKGSDTVLWSIMKVKEKSEFLNAVNEILASYKYKSEVAYRSNDKFKYGPCRELINLISKHPVVSFEMYFIQDAKSMFSDVSPEKYQANIAKIFSSFKLLGEKSNNLIAKCENRYGPSELLKNECDKAIGGNLITTNAKLDKLLQVNNLISGLVYSFITETKTKNKVKLNLRKDFDGKYAISEKKNGKFTIKNINVTNI